MEIGRMLGDFLVWLVDLIGIVVPKIFSAVGGIIAIVLVAAYLAFRISVTFGPKKQCFRCGGSGHHGGLFGGRKECSWCNGTGLRDRIGS